jgi:multiple sugar transport system ATP-binding protein
VYVTHDQVEAMSMADRIAVLREGVIQQVDPPETIYNKPANRFVATVVGSPPMNFIPVRGSLANGSLRLEHEAFEVRVAAGSVPRSSRTAECWIGVRPEDVHIEPAGDTGISATVYVTEPLGGETVVDLQIGDRVVKALAPATLTFAQDQRVSVRLDTTRLHVFAEDGGALVSAAGGDSFEVRVRSSD